MGQIRRWWVQKYKLPPNHPLLESRTLADLTEEMYEDLYIKKQELEEELAAEGSMGEKPKLMNALNAINRALGEEEVVHDPLADEWEKDIAEGRIPDLDRR